MVEYLSAAVDKSAALLFFMPDDLKNIVHL